MTRALNQVSRSFVANVYATHNTSEPIERAIRSCLDRLSPGERALNVGAGASAIDERVVNLDIAAGEQTDCVAAAEALPFVDGAFSLVISQETLEHVSAPLTAVKEIYRVLRPGGRFYCQVPFVIGYHPGPTDYWRFTKEGIRHLIERGGFTCEEVRVAVGPGTGFYRIAVEFLAVLAARVHPSMYRLAKGGFAVVAYPLKWLDRVLSSGPQADRVPGGYYAIGRR